MCTDLDNVAGTGTLKCWAVFMLIMSLLHMDLFDIIFYSTIVCGCCGPAYKMKTCLLIFSLIILFFNTAGLVTISSIGGSLSAYAGGACVEEKICRNITGTSGTCTNGGICTMDGKLPSARRELVEEASPFMSKAQSFALVKPSAVSMAAQFAPLLSPMMGNVARRRLAINDTLQDAQDMASDVANRTAAAAQDLYDQNVETWKRGRAFWEARSSFETGPICCQYPAPVAGAPTWCQPYASITIDNVNKDFTCEGIGFIGTVLTAAGLVAFAIKVLFQLITTIFICRLGTAPRNDPKFTAP